MKMSNLLLQTVYSGVTYAGYVGVLTGQRPNSFTVSIDARRKLVVDNHCRCAMSSEQINSSNFQQMTTGCDICENIFVNSSTFSLFNIAFKITLCSFPHRFITIRPQLVFGSGIVQCILLKNQTFAFSFHYR